MAKIVIELTNRCNLNCHHCFSGRHGGRDDLPLAVLAKILAEAQGHGFDQLSFTGGDPTVYRHFLTVLEQTTAAGYDFGLNTNGWNFVQIYPQLLPYRTRLRVITFSLDGASAETHDRLRGAGSFRRVLQAASVCVVEGLPFSFNMVVTAHNRHELAAMAQLAARLGSRGLRFGHLMPAPLSTAQGLDLSPAQRKAVEAEIWQLRRTADLPVAMAPGYQTADLFPCAPLQGQELNVDCHGNLTLCCHLSGQGGDGAQGDVVGSLLELSFGEAYGRWRAEQSRFRAAKEIHFDQGPVGESASFPCWYCARQYGKVAWMRGVEGSEWGELVDEGR